jgi:hypothetical protein
VPPGRIEGERYEWSHSVGSRKKAMGFQAMMFHAVLCCMVGKWRFERTWHCLHGVDQSSVVISGSAARLSIFLFFSLLTLSCIRHNHREEYEIRRSVPSLAPSLEHVLVYWYGKAESRLQRSQGCGAASQDVCLPYAMHSWPLQEQPPPPQGGHSSTKERECFVIGSGLQCSSLAT